MSQYCRYCINAEDYNGEGEREYQPRPPRTPSEYEQTRLF